MRGFVGSFPGAWVPFLTPHLPDLGCIVCGTSLNLSHVLPVRMHGMPGDGLAGRLDVQGGVPEDRTCP